jgi:cytochrome c-type biogenesis protein
VPGGVLADSFIHLSYPLSFLAGLVSFLSPCVFPLVPVYVAYLSGRAGEPALAGLEASVGTDGAAVLGNRPSQALASERVPVLANGVAFVLGFSTVFITLFYVLSALDVQLVAQHRRALDLAAGVIVIVLGLQILGVVRIGALMRERRHLVMRDGAGMIASFVLGVSFAAGWTPCIGPQLGAVLTVAAQGDFGGLPVMVAYCLGLGIPFLVIAAVTDRAQAGLRSLNRHLGVVNVVAGLLLLVFGGLLVAGSLTVLNRFAGTSPFDL